MSACSNAPEKAETCPYCASRGKCFIHTSTICNSESFATRNPDRRERKIVENTSGEISLEPSQNGGIGDSNHNSHPRKLIIRGKRGRKDPMILQRNKRCKKSSLHINVPSKSGEEVSDTNSDEEGNGIKQDSNTIKKLDGGTAEPAKGISGHEKNYESASEYSRFSKTSDSESDSDNDEDIHKISTENNGLSAYEQLRLVRIQRNMARLVSIDELLYVILQQQQLMLFSFSSFPPKESLGLGVNKNSHDNKKAKAKRKAKKKPASTIKVRNRYPKRSRKQTTQNKKATQLYQKQKTNNVALFKGDHDDDCYICQDGGELVCCDYCSKAFHMQCHIPPLLDISDGEWMCCECKATREYLVHEMH